MVFSKFLRWCPQVDNEFEEYEKHSNFKIFKVMKSTSKTKIYIQLFAFEHHF